VVVSRAESHWSTTLSRVNLNGDQAATNIALRRGRLTVQSLLRASTEPSLTLVRKVRRIGGMQQARACSHHSGAYAAATLTNSANSLFHAPNACFDFSPPVTLLARTLFHRTGRVFQCTCSIAVVKRPCLLANSVAEMSSAPSERQK
jgi:hypothetical protein